MCMNNKNYCNTFILCFLIIIVCGLHAAFGKTFEVNPFMDFNCSIHGGLGDNYKGFAFSVGAGTEVLYVVNSDFAFGLNAKTNLNMDIYNKKHNHDIVVDEYGTWTVTGGGIVYMGDMLYLSYMAIYNLDTFHEDTYLSTNDGDIDIKKLKYNIDALDYLVEIGLRTSFHFSVYVDVTTHLVESEIDMSKYQVYVGLKYHI